MSTPCSIRFIVPLVLLCVALTTTANGVVVWDGGGAFNNWSNSLNWNPNGLPGTADDVIISQSVDTQIDQLFAIRGLGLSGSATADTHGNTLAISSGDLDIGLASRFIVSEHSSHASGSNALEIASELSVANLGMLEMNGGRVLMFNEGRLNINLGGRLRGFGELKLNATNLTSPTAVLTNNGALETGRAVGSAAAEHFTLTLSASDEDARIDWDGVNNDRVISIAENTTLDVDLKATDLWGTLSMAAGSKLDMAQPWLMRGTSVLNVDAGLPAAGVPATATIKGNHLNAIGNAQFNVNSGTLIFDANFDSGAQPDINVSTNAGLQFDRHALYDGDLNFLGRNIDFNVNSDVEITDDNWDWDGNLSSTRTTVTGATLKISGNQLSAAGDNTYAGEVRLNDGARLDIRSDSNGWTLAGSLTSQSASVDNFVVSDLILDGATIVVSDGKLRLSREVDFAGSGLTSVAANSSLYFQSDVTFAGGSNFVGAGSLDFWSGTHRVNGDQTINMPSGKVVLDGNFGVGIQVFELNADLTVNASSLGLNNNFGENAADRISINNANSTLTVNLTNSSDEWTLEQAGIIDISGSGTLNTSIAGSDLNVRGIVNVDGKTRFTARIDLEQPGLINLSSANSALHLQGGTSADPNRIAGGSIVGNNAQLASSGSRALAGFGTINPDINFSAGADLQAEGGTLVLNGSIINADILGARSGATLQLNNALDTALINALELTGGIVQGQAIDNNGAIRGHGTVRTIGLSNMGSISAEGGELVIDTINAPDLDSFGSVATLNAVMGDLTVVDALTDDFSGHATIGPGRTMAFQNGWTQGPLGELSLMGTNTEAATMQGGQMLLRGTTTVDRQAEISAPTTFGSTAELVFGSTVTDLILKADSTVQKGATFTGPVGAEVINDGFVMTLDHLATVDIRLENRGQLSVAESGIGQGSVRSFEQSNAGSVEFHIAGDMPGEYDVIDWQASALLDGELQVTLLGGFTPSLGDRFHLMTSLLGLTSGTFATTSLPELPETLDWFIDYSDIHAVVLEIINVATTGDFDNDGDFACNDIDMLVAALANGAHDAEFDLTGDGTVDGDDLEAWLAEAGAAELLSGMPYLPGDANLDGVVDGQDFIEWNTHKFTNSPTWCSGDFNADGVVDGQDFIAWNDNKFTSADANFSAVPEPNFVWLWLVVVALGFVPRCSSVDSHR